MIARYNTPMAELVPPTNVEKVQRKSGKGEAELIDPRALDPKSDEEADAYPKGFH